ncbi:MAG: hypothetical protein F4056_02895 [Chloroflexi bacterium]|nr:hypothetical protein [Chloroflexota bacterium]
MVQITIRNVSEEVRDELKARAARQRQSMQEYLRGELERIASKPSIDEWLEEVRARKAADPAYIGADTILRHRDADRK